MQNLVSWSFLAVTLVGAAFTFNAYLPHRGRTPLIVPSFFAGWLTGELSAHHFAWQLVATIVFVAAGALEAWPGWLGLGLTLVSWGFLLSLVPLSDRTASVVRRALDAGIGADHETRIEPELVARLDEPLPARQLVLPFSFTEPGVRVTRDVRYADGAGKRHLLDVYAPEGADGRNPVLLQVHGGGWTIGDKRQQGLPLMNHLAARGWVCVACNYRLSPKATFPEHLIDVKLALRWVREQIAEHGGDADFVAITGGSAGGHLSSLAALTAGDPEYQPGFEETDTSIQACVPFYGVYDFTDEEGNNQGLETFLERTVLKRKLAEDRTAFLRASPTHRVHADAPPFFVIHGSHDSLAPVEEARRFVTKLQAASKEPVAYAEVPGAQHAFEVFHSLRTRHVVRGVERFLAWAVSRHRAAAPVVLAGRG